ncbi:MAG: histidine kinase dimerization/phospho-acceptor domain-containing protein, partial [Desulfobacteraceae bacterium]
MSTTESDPTHTETQETTAAVPRVSGPEADGEQSPQTLWTNLRHELRTPVDAIIRSSERLREDADGPGQAEFIANLSGIHFAGRQLREIINDLLDSAKYASGDAVSNLASLIANLHYKVRLPINDVIGLSETLLENAAAQGRLDLIADLKKIQSAAEYILSYINEIIDFSKIDAGLKKSGAEDSERLSLIDRVMISLRGLAQDSAA